jgi:hypothetical protein
MIIKIFYISLILVLTSCTKDIEIDIPEKEKKLVLYSTIVPFTLPQPKFNGFRISETRHIFDTTKSNVKDARIILYINEVITDTIYYSEEGNNYPMKLEHYPKSGENFRVEVEKDYFPKLIAETAIPSKVEITNCELIPFAFLNEEGRPVSEITLSFKDPANEINYYEIAVSDAAFSYEDDVNFYKLSSNDRIITSESYYPDAIRFDVPNPKYLLFNDSEINGKEHTFKIYYNTSFIYSETNYIPPHYITVHFRSVSREYYYFKTSLIKQSYNKREDILYGIGEPVEVYTNIKNGFGIFAGFNNDFAHFQVDKIIVE